MNGPSADLVTDDLPPPYIRESRVSGLLNPVVLRNSCTIGIPYLTDPSDRVSITWAGAPGAGSYTSVFFPVGELRPLEVGIGGALLAIFNLGTTVILTYTVIRGTAEPVTSQPLIVYVLPIAQIDLPRPVIPQAQDFGEGLILDVNNLTEFTLRINAWPLLMRGQYFWLRLRGTNADDSVFNEVYWSAPGNVVDQEFSRGFYARNYSADPLKGLKDRSTLTLALMAGLEGSQDEALAQPFAHRNYIVRTGAPITPVRPVIVSVKDSLNQDIIDGGDTALGSVTVAGTAMAGGKVEIFDGLISKGTVRAVSGRWEHRVNGLLNGSHVLTAKALYGETEVSNSWTINVKLQERQLSIKEAPDNVSLDPLAALRSLTAVLDYESEPGDLITVTWTAASGTLPAGSHTTSAVVAGNTRPRKIPLPVSLVAFSLGKKAELTFTYTRVPSDPVTSQPFPLNVLTIPATEFIAPVITQANGTAVLDLKDVLAGATLQFGSWRHNAPGQRISLVLEGEHTSGGNHNLQKWVNTRNSVHRAWVTNNGYSITIANSYLQFLRDGSRLFIKFRVNMDQVPNPATAVVFDTREYTIRAAP
jgi:hypothetical protein